MRDLAAVPRPRRGRRLYKRVTRSHVGATRASPLQFTLGIPYHRGVARAIAIETSSRIGSLAASDGERVLAEEQFEHGLQHAAQVVPILDRLCRAQGWSPRDVEHLYISAGPGSFTGLRIGVTLAKTMALTTGVKLVAVPSVRVLAENAPADAR